MNELHCAAKFFTTLSNKSASVHGEYWLPMAQELLLFQSNPITYDISVKRNSETCSRTNVRFESRIKFGKKVITNF